jgi:hypothetical protein
MLPITVNTPPYPALLVIFAMFSSLPDFDQASIERGGTIVQYSIYPVEGLLAFLTLSLSFFCTTLLLSL